MGIRIKKHKKSNGYGRTNIKELKAHIQTLCRSTNPLAKCLDFVHDDIEGMNKEIKSLRQSFMMHTEQLIKEQKKTEESLAPLQNDLLQIGEEIKEVIQKIHKKKAQIAQGDKQMKELLGFIVNTE